MEQFIQPVKEQNNGQETVTTLGDKTASQLSFETRVMPV